LNLDLKAITNTSLPSGLARGGYRGNGAVGRDYLDGLRKKMRVNLTMLIDRRFITLLSVCIVLSTLLLSSALEAREGMPVTREEAINIAKKEAVKLGYDVESMDLEIDENNTAWNKYVKYLELDPDMKSQLKSTTFWAVYYGPRYDPNNPVLGGDVWVLIDRSDGRVITIIRGK
jgi:hypothetical protein